jgi:hypothetical protein
MAPNAAETAVDVLTIDLKKGFARDRIAGSVKTSRWGWEAVRAK